VRAITPRRLRSDGRAGDQLLGQGVSEESVVEFLAEKRRTARPPGSAAPDVRAGPRTHTDRPATPSSTSSTPAAAHAIVRHAIRRPGTAGDAGASTACTAAEAVTRARNRFDDARHLGAVAEGLANLLDASVDSLVELDVNVGRPDVLPDRVPRDRLVRARDQQGQQAQRLGLQPTIRTRAAQFSPPGIELEHAETVSAPLGCGRSRGHAPSKALYSRRSCCDRGSGRAFGVLALRDLDVLKVRRRSESLRVPEITTISTVSRRTFVNKAP